MNNIFEKLNILLTESEGVSKVKESDIPIHPEMETKEQGEIHRHRICLWCNREYKGNL